MPDTSGERFTAMSISLPWRGVAVPPDGSTQAANRIADAYYYGFSYGPTEEWICVEAAQIQQFVATGVISEALATGTIICKGL